MEGLTRRSRWIGTVVAAVVMAGVSASPAFATGRTWYLRNANSTGVADTWFSFGDTTQTPFAGDWNGDGRDAPGVQRGTTSSLWWLANTLTGATSVYFTYGSPGMVPVTGDWDGNGTDTAAMRQGLRWYISNVNGNVVASYVFDYGNPSGDIPLSGDWNGDGRDTPGVYRVATSTFYLSNSPTAAAPFAVRYGNPGDKPLVGDWNGDGKDTIGVFRVDSLGARWHLNNANDTSAPDVVFTYGSPGDTPVTGDWDGDGIDTPGVVRASASPPPPRPTLYDGDLIRDSGTSAVFYYEDEAVYYVPSQAVADAAGLDLATVQNVPAGTVALFPRGDNMSAADFAENDAGLIITDPDNDAVIAGNNYKFASEVTFDFDSANGKSAAFGSVKWYHGKFPRGYIHRGMFTRGSGDIPQSPVGCLWTKVKWGWPNITGGASFSLPTSGGASIGIDGAATEMPYAVRCRKSGDDYPDTISYAGIGYAKGMLNSVTIEICNSGQRDDGPLNCSWHKVKYRKD
jgi:hypothetical protein